jgi:hypothetical protein
VGLPDSSFLTPLKKVLDPGGIVDVGIRHNHRRRSKNRS